MPDPPSSLSCQAATELLRPMNRSTFRAGARLLRRVAKTLVSWSLGKATPGHLTLGGRRGRSRPLTDTATAAMHMARTVHQTVFDDSPRPSDAGNVLTRRATNGRRVGAIRISATAPETGP